MQRSAEWNEAETLEIVGRHAQREGPLLPILHDDAGDASAMSRATPFR